MHTVDCSDSTGALSSALVVDDHPLYSDALVSTLRSDNASCDVRTAGSLADTFEILETGFEPELLMLDLKLPDVSGISGFEQLKQRLRGTRILVISSMATSDLVRQLLALGASGFMPKESSASALRRAVNEVSAGRRYVPKEYQSVFTGEEPEQKTCDFYSNPGLDHLTPQQKRILKLICEGMPNKLIAYELSLAETTVKAHITALLRRLGVSNRTQAAVMVESLTARSGETPDVTAFLKN